ncbi:toll-like receptor 6 [Hyla sarda]|uniref:toll-like receptor 6 n=1 Tax=Hyla sarda TaxID=327740 RepID=UPI0024C3A059|nr:toll-like receptor 6 [Hyla sarda]XP_056412664.1 toll-like receptor 6 [Hyla sarda]XP_056412674.1 toll-like receptor 6 [Hyla sarda]XP_056412680.1 toll-like receptor 6 [Hyla sarda]
MATFIILTLASVFMPALCDQHSVMESDDVIANYSYKSLTSVPSNLSLQTTILDLSYNFIQKLETKDFGYLLDLRVLNLSCNQITKMDSHVFDSNNNLVYLDLSNNRLENVSNSFPSNLRHLDISSNKFITLSVCRSFTNLLRLEYLGFSASNILKSDLEFVSHLRLQQVFIDLSGLYQYENSSLLVLNTNRLHLSSLSDQKDLFSVLFDAVNTSKFLELSKFGKWDVGKVYDGYISAIVNNSRVTHLSLRDLGLLWIHLIQILQKIWHSSLESLHVYNLTIQGFISKIYFDYSNTSVTELLFDHVAVEAFLFNQSDLYSVFSEMNIKNLTITNSNLLFMTCPLKPSTFEYIDFSKNAVTNDVFQDCSTLTKLKMLKLAGNKLQKLSKVSLMTEKMTSLQHLDVSQNPLDYTEEDCHWSSSIRTLNMASCSLPSSVFLCLPKNVKRVNLRNNDILEVPLEITHLINLEYLNLEYNRLSDLPDCTLFPRLMIISVEFNQVPYPSSESLKNCSGPKQINIANNPFHCFCEINTFIYEGKKNPGKFIGWPDDYVCERPEDFKGVRLKDFYLPEMYCNVFIMVSVIVVPIIVGLLLFLCLCKYFDIPWFLKMIWQLIRTKHRARNSKNGYQELRRDFSFHAFISYSENDASWVKNILLPSMQSINDIRICQHERNFTPGKSIVENIINCIDNSYKSIFVLSPHFVQSEWCHYELYFAEHKLYSENTDNLILILLEPIPQYLIPSRYFKLKALMKQRTYLEWPNEKSKHTLFFANLRAAISINLSESEQESSVSVPSVNA